MDRAVKRSLRTAIPLLLFAACGTGMLNDEQIAFLRQDALARSYAPMVVARLKGFSFLFADEQTTLAPSRSDGANADAVAVRLQSQLGFCPSATIVHSPGSNAIVAVFNQCGLPRLPSVALQANATVTSDGGVTLDLRLQGLGAADATIGDSRVDGELLLFTSDGVSYETRAALQTSAYSLTFDGASQMDIDGRGASLNGLGVQLPIDDATVPFTLERTHAAFNDCAANSGSVAFGPREVYVRADQVIPVTAAIAFDANTGSSGHVTILLDGQRQTDHLPQCP